MSAQFESAAAGPPLQLRVRAGQLQGDESWVYAWFSKTDRAVVYVGSTPLPPAVRTWLHLNDPDPDIGRVAARLPRARDEDFDVLAARVPVDQSRARLRDELVDALSQEGLLSERYAGPEPGQQPESERGLGHVVTNLVEAIRHQARTS